MRARLAIAITLLLLSGCKTLDLSAITGRGSGTTLTKVSSVPAGALVTVEGFGECETPCTIEIDKPRNITVARAGYEPQRFVLSLGQRTLKVELQLSAVSTGVDAAELPEL